MDKTYEEVPSLVESTVVIPATIRTIFIHNTTLFLFLLVLIGIVLLICIYIYIYILILRGEEPSFFVKHGVSAALTISVFLFSRWIDQLNALNGREC